MMFQRRHSLHHRDVRIAQMPIVTDEPKWPGVKFNGTLLLIVLAIIAFDLWRVS